MIVDLFLKVVNLSIGATPLMAALLVLRLLFKKAVPRKVFYIAWALVFLRLMVPFSLESDLSFFNIVPEATVVEENVGTSVVFVENENEQVEFPVFVNLGADNPNVDAPYHSAITGEIVTGPDITTVPMDKNLILSTVWIFGTSALLLFGMIGYFAVLRKLRFESIEYTDKIRLSEFFKTPVVCGLFHPKIILPMNFDLDDEAKINSVISHECTHIRRKDNLWRLLATFTLYVHWFNPLVWICYNAFIRDMEVSCDEAVLSGAKNDIRTEYAESLVALAGNGTNPLYGGVLSFGECAIKERVKCIMNFKKTTVLVIILCIAAALALGVIFLTNPSVPAENEEISYNIVMEEGTEAKYSKENGLDVKTIITNTDDRTIWLGSATYIYHSADAETNGGTFAGICANDGVIMLRPGESAVFSDNISTDKFNGNYRFTLPDGYYTLQREIFLDEALTPTPYYAEFSFEIKESRTSTISFDSARIGNIVTFGNYNGALEWLVIGEKEDQLLLITKDCIEAFPYNTERKKVTWESCDLRKWLNGEFIETAFAEEERNIIVSTKLENPDNKRYGGAIGGNSTTDRVFLLSHDEVLEYFPGGFDIYTELSPSAEKDITKYEIDGREFWWWWTRSPGLGQDMATVVNAVTFGVGDDGLVVSEKHGVRPAVWVNKNWEEQKFVPEPEEEPETNPQPSTDNPEGESGEGPAPVQLGEEYLIPYNTGVIAGLFCNNEKTYIPVSSATALVELREILAYKNFTNFTKEDETESSELGKALEGVDVVEFARTEDGKKYNLSLYENGFILSGSAVDENDKGKIWIVEKEAWSNFKYIVKTMFENASFRNPYWLGLANEKNVDIVWITLNKGNFITYNNEMDCFELLIPIIRGISVEASATRLTESTSEEIIPKIKEDYIHVSMNFFTDTVYDIYITETELYIVSNDMKYSLYYKLSEPGITFNELYSFAVEEEAEANPATAKPVIYLYPETETVVSVNLDFDGRLTYTYPALNDGWKVLAKPDGTLINLADNSTHYYLFWEGTARPKWTYEKGFVIKGSETEKFLRKTLAKMGLTPREYNDFITYWVPKMQENPYNLISFSGDEYSEIAKLTVDPKPDTVIRIHMVWKALDAPVDIEPQIIPTYERRGFTLVEWGGTEVF